MGEVWKARDIQLGREVAIKTLPDDVASDPERLARFRREAELLASLNHPNIAVIHGLEESGGIKALVMELVDGLTLADRIEQGPIPVDEALSIARQITEAVETAHEQGIVHRDLKPGNIMLRPDGTVKVLDFGLAKALDRSAQAGEDTPTVTMTAETRAGTTLGTPAYMSPEQARGKSVDRRTDIWAFGCILFEMLTGERAFAAETQSATMSRVLTRDIDWSTLSRGVPPSIRQLGQRCLDRDVRRRLRDIGEARLVLENPIPTEGIVEESGGSRAHRVPAVVAVTLLLLGATAGGFLVFRLSEPAAAPVVSQTSILPPHTQNFSYVGRRALEIGRSGIHMVYSATGGIWRRLLREPVASLVSGTHTDARSPYLIPGRRVDRILVFGGAVAHSIERRFPNSAGRACP